MGTVFGGRAISNPALTRVHFFGRLLHLLSASIGLRRPTGAHARPPRWPPAAVAFEPPPRVRPAAIPSLPLWYKRSSCCPLTRISFTPCLPQPNPPLPNLPSSSSSRWTARQLAACHSLRAPRGKPSWRESARSTTCLRVPSPRRTSTRTATKSRSTAMRSCSYSTPTSTRARCSRWTCVRLGEAQQGRMTRARKRAHGLGSVCEVDAGVA